MLGPVLLPLVFGAAYAGSVEPFLWLLPSAIGFVASAVFSNALLASGAPALSSLGPVVSLTVGVALDLVLIPRLGATGAAIAASAALLAAARRRPSPTAVRVRAAPRRPGAAAGRRRAARPAARCAGPAPGPRSRGGGRASA